MTGTALYGYPDCPRVSVRVYFTWLLQILNSQLLQVLSSVRGVVGGGVEAILKMHP